MRLKILINLLLGTVVRFKHLQQTCTVPFRNNGTPPDVVIGAMVNYADDTFVYLHGFQ